LKKRNLKEVFLRLDMNGDGNIDPEEIMRYLIDENNMPDEEAE